MPSSSKGLRIVEFLRKELSIPESAQSVSISYAAGRPFSVTTTYLPEGGSAAEIEVTTLCSATREFIPDDRAPADGGAR